MPLIRDANILVTDHAVAEAYESRLDPESSALIQVPELFFLNLGGPSQDPFRALESLEHRFYCIAGSSNFHHLDAVNLSRLRKMLGEPLQLVLVDQHMDCVLFEGDADLLHCGNWVSFAYRRGFISKVAMIGCRDYRRLPNFDGSLEKNSCLAYYPDPAQSRLDGFLDPAKPVYLSIDTDVLTEPSDWNRGLHALGDILRAPFWDFLERSRWVGTFLHGHVTDNRRFMDLTRAMLSGKAPKKRENFFKDLGVNVAHALWPKLLASFSPRISQERQLEIMLSLYSRAEQVRRSLPAP